MNLVLAVTLLLVLVPAAFAGGYVSGQRRALRPSPPREQMPAELTPMEFTPSSLTSLVKRTGAELTQIAVQTGVEIGNRAIRDSLGSLSAWALRERPDLRQVTAEDGTVTLLFSDIEGSTALNERLGDEAWIAVLSTHDELVRRCVREARGQVIKTQGDSFMVAFADPQRAVTCAVAVQRALGEMPASPNGRVRVRVGVHRGPAIARGRDLFGITVATAARVAAEASGGEILITDAVAAHAGDAVALGRPRTVRLKGLSEAQQVVPVRWSEAATNPGDDAPEARRRSRRQAR